VKKNPLIDFRTIHTVILNIEIVGFKIHGFENATRIYFRIALCLFVYLENDVL